MSEELEEDFDNLEGITVPILREYSKFQRPLAEVTGPEQELVWQKIRGDMEFGGAIFNRFESHDAVKEYYSVYADPDTPDDLDKDEKCIQGWTYVADYTIHSLSPGCEVFKYYIHARIRENYEIEFAAFEFVHD